MSEIDQSTKLFNTAVVATKALTTKNHSRQLNDLISSKAFHAIVQAIRYHAVATGIDEEQAAEEIVQTFRQIDTIWDEYIFQEGLDRLKTIFQGTGSQ